MGRGRSHLFTQKGPLYHKNDAGCFFRRSLSIRLGPTSKTIVIEPVVDEWSPGFLASAGTWDEPIERPGRDDEARDSFA